MKKTCPHQKVIDYQHMMAIILKDFKLSQSKKLPWKIHIGDSLELQEIYFKTPVLYLIGDSVFILMID